MDSKTSRWLPSGLIAARRLAVWRKQSAAIASISTALPSQGIGRHQRQSEECKARARNDGWGTITLHNTSDALLSQSKNRPGAVHFLPHDDIPRQLARVSMLLRCKLMFYVCIVRMEWSTQLHSRLVAEHGQVPVSIIETPRVLIVCRQISV